MGIYLGILQVGVSVHSLIKHKDLASCTFPEGFASQVGILNWLWIQTGLGAADMLFPLYIHLMLYRRLVAEAKTPDDPNRGPSDRTLEAREGGPIRVSRHDIYEAFKETFQKDPITYAYMVIIISSLTWAILGWVWIVQGGLAECNPDKIWPLSGCWLALFFVGFIAFYGGTWLYQLTYYEPTDVLTLRSGGDEKEMGFHEKPPEPPPQQDNEQTGLMSWFSHGNNNNKPVTATPDPPKPKPKSKIRLGIKLLASFFLDMLGNITYFVPYVGEAGDAVFAPASAVMLKMLYNSNGIAAIGCTEEILPFTDLTPTATIAWFMENVCGNNCCTRCFGFAQKQA